MTISTQQVGGITVVNVGGPIVGGQQDAALRELFRDLLSKGRRQILLNLGNADYIDSTGLGTLVGALASVKKENGELKLLNLTNKVRDIMQITKLYTVFDILKYEDEAASLSDNHKRHRHDRDEVVANRA